MLKIKDKAPAFDSIDDSGKNVSLKDLKGKTVVLYFYPKDLTPGCTQEARAFQDDSRKILAIFPKVKVKGHAEEVLEVLRAT